MSDVFIPQTGATAGPSRYQVLALSGGGFRGLFTASVLAAVEEHETSHRIRDHFDLVAGTSIGGIIACAIAVGIPAHTIAKSFREHGNDIFGRRRWRNIFTLGLVGSAYSSTPLEVLIKGVLGKHAQISLKDIQMPLLLPTVDAASSRAVILRSGGLDPVRSQSMTLLDAALATSAAPTFFRAHQRSPHIFVDGGLIANAPDMVALTAALRSKELREVHMLSIGTCAMKPARPLRSVIDSGRARWVVRHKVIDLTISAQESLAIDSIQNFLGDRYLRIDETPQPREQKHVKLDKAGKKSIAALESLASVAFDKSRGRKLKAFFTRVRP